MIERLKSLIGKLGKQPSPAMLQRHDAVDAEMARLQA